MKHETADRPFQDIHNTFRPRILRYLGRLVGKHEAEDLAQEVFVKVERGLSRFRGDARFSTWIYRIATNAAVDRMRGVSARQRAELRLFEDVRQFGEVPSLDQHLIRKDMQGDRRHPRPERADGQDPAASRTGATAPRVEGEL